MENEQSLVYKQIIGDLLAKIVKLEVEKKQLEEKLARVQPSPAESFLSELNKIYPEVNVVQKMREEVCKNYPNLFAKSPLENLRDGLGKNYPELTRAEDVSDLSKNFITLLMKNIME